MHHRIPIFATNTLLALLILISQMYKPYNVFVLMLFEIDIFQSNQWRSHQFPQNEKFITAKGLNTSQRECGPIQQ